MTENQLHVENGRQMAFYMDLLGHDVLNSNQAVQGYLELILATPAADKTVKKYAEKAVSHIRTSTILIDNIKKLMASRATAPESYKPVDLMAIILRSDRELSRDFPDKTIRLSISPKIDEAYVMGSGFAEDLVLNVLVSMIRLDQREEVDLSLKLKEISRDGKMFWSMTVEDPGANLPPAMKDNDVEAVFRQDNSTAVKIVGLLFAKMIATSMGGDFETYRLGGKTEDEGSAFVVTLRKAGKP